jgi:hypothetical protein
MRSRARHTPFLKALSVFLFLLLVTMPLYVQKIEPDDPKSALIFNSIYFYIVLSGAFLVGVSIFLLLFLRSKKVTIDQNTITVKYFLKPAKAYTLADINQILWGSAIGKLGFIGPMATRAKSRTDDVLISFRDGSSLYFSVGEYKNFDELRAWFLNYGKKAGLIKSRNK